MSTPPSPEPPLPRSSNAPKIISVAPPPPRIPGQSALLNSSALAMSAERKIGVMYVSQPIMYRLFRLHSVTVNCCRRACCPPQSPRSWEQRPPKANIKLTFVADRAARRLHGGDGSWDQPDGRGTGIGPCQGRGRR